jgi:hypothetical protein
LDYERDPVEMHGAKPAIGRDAGPFFGADVDQVNDGCGLFSKGRFAPWIGLVFLRRIAFQTRI